MNNFIFSVAIGTVLVAPIAFIVGLIKPTAILPFKNCNRLSTSLYTLIALPLFCTFVAGISATILGATTQQPQPQLLSVLVGMFLPFLPAVRKSKMSAVNSHTSLLDLLRPSRRKAVREIDNMVRNALSDDKLSDTEISEIENRCRELSVSTDRVEKLRKIHFETAIHSIVKDIRKTQRCSPEQEEKLNKLAADLQITVDESDLHIARHLWDIEHGLPFIPKPIQCDIRLKKDEKCFHTARCSWHQMKTVKIRHGTVGSSMRVKIAKGVSIRVGSSRTITSESDELTELDRGDLYITNKRLVFVGFKKSVEITMGRIIRCQLYRDGVEIVKSSGKPDLFRIDHEIDAQYIDVLLQMID